MLKRIWRWLKSLLRRWWGTPPQPSNVGNGTPQQRQILTDTEYESFFLELLAGVNDSWSRDNVQGFLESKNILLCCNYLKENQFQNIFFTIA